MSQCHDNKEKLKALVWGELSDDNAVRLHQHVEGCADCRKELHAWVEFQELLKKAPAPQPAELFWESYQKTLAQKLDNLDHSPKAKKVRTWSWNVLGIRPAYAFGMILLAVGIGLLLRFSEPEKKQRGWRSLLHRKTGLIFMLKNSMKWQKMKC